MFKRLGTFAVLAVCLFAIAMVMVGCGRDDPPIDKPIDPPPVEKPIVPKVETPLEKLAGSYNLVEVFDGIITLRIPEVDGRLYMEEGGGDWFWSLNFVNLDNGLVKNSGETWSPSATGIAFITSDGEWLGTEYTLVGSLLTLERDDLITKWRKK